MSEQPKDLSRTMRIDLIPDVPARPASSERKRVVIAPRRLRPQPTPVPAEHHESHFQKLLQHLYDAALIVDLKGRILDVDVRTQEFVQYTRQELLELTVFDIIASTDDQVLRTVSENLENERHTLIQAYCVRKDGTHFPAEIAVSKLELGTVCLCFFVRDITIRRQAEEMLITEHNAIQNSGNAIAVVDRAGNLEYANPAMERMWGCQSHADLLGRDLRSLVLDQSAMDTMIRELLEGVTETLAVELQARRRDGTEFAAEFSGVRNRNAEGETVGCVFSVVDISDRKRADLAERELERRRVMLESLGAACHHLGQPATMLLGNLELLDDRLRDAHPDVRKLVTSSLQAVERLAAVLRRLNAVNEYRTTEYLQQSDEASGEGSRILEI